MTLRELLSQIVRHLSVHQVPDPEIESEVLIRHVLGLERAEFFASLAESVSFQQSCVVRQLVQRRLSGEPLAYITGHKEFYGLDFMINPNVLIPRQETELLVDYALEYCSNQNSSTEIRIADVGTGSGAIAIAIAINRENAHIIATDCDEKALAVTRMNLQKHNLADRVHVSQGDLLETIEGPLDICVANLPYIRSAEIPELPREVQREPLLSLDGGSDGLDLIRRLLLQLPALTKPNGSVFLEISPEQLHPTLLLARAAFRDAEITYRNDMLHLPRIVVINRNTP